MNSSKLAFGFVLSLSLIFSGCSLTSPFSDNTKQKNKNNKQQDQQMRDFNTGEKQKADKNQKSKEKDNKMRNKETSSQKKEKNNTKRKEKITVSKPPCSMPEVCPAPNNSKDPVMTCYEPRSVKDGKDIVVDIYGKNLMNEDKTIDHLAYRHSQMEGGAKTQDNFKDMGNCKVSAELIVKNSPFVKPGKPVEFRLVSKTKESVNTGTARMTDGWQKINITSTTASNTSSSKKSNTTSKKSSKQKQSTSTKNKQTNTSSSKNTTTKKSSQGNFSVQVIGRKRLDEDNDGYQEITSPYTFINYKNQSGKKEIKTKAKLKATLIMDGKEVLAKTKQLPQKSYGSSTELKIKLNRENIKNSDRPTGEGKSADIKVTFMPESGGEFSGVKEGGSYIETAKSYKEKSKED
jgi:hypothetical protein